jgi:hypothetical protein
MYIKFFLGIYLSAIWFSMQPLNTFQAEMNLIDGITGRVRESQRGNLREIPNFYERFVSSLCAMRMASAISAASTAGRTA